MKNGFTLVELLAVIIILAVLATITTITINTTISNSKDSLLNTQKKFIEEAAKEYYLKEGDLDQNACVDLSTLISSGYIESNKVIDPKTKQEMTGSVNIVYTSNQYTYTYQDEACS